ncbi:hypothetical protein IEQ34_008713 [Dendrobium chrysotoxum]|uniref:Uncharacterized protein n=1 Tax=Dendrobium chrysotoxum TaxID=161865 RepID=A0AAV7H0M2_DENCH|nr:hypothetical protein IEQ34_008713 [Dendrobium chrysotoxum]
MFYLPKVSERLVQHQPTQYPTSEELSIGKIKFKAFDLGGHQIAQRVGKDYYGSERIIMQRSERGLLFTRNFGSIPTSPPFRRNYGKLGLSDHAKKSVYGRCHLSRTPRPCKVFNPPPRLRKRVDAVVYLVDAEDKGRFTETKKELDALLSDDSLANVPFHILGNRIDRPYAASEEELCYHLRLTNFTTGKDKVNLTDSNVRPLEVFMCSIVGKMGYGDGFKWLSQHIK